MLKIILKLEGVQELSKNEQKKINGGSYWCSRGCSGAQYLSNSPCKPQQMC
jgi:hypothetical protein